MHLSTTIVATVLAAAAAVNGAATTVFPTSAGSVTKPTAIPIAAGKTFDGSMRKFDRSTSTCQDGVETGQADAIFILEDGAKIKNVIIGPNNGEGIHCKGTCTIQNVWWLNVCEDAATFWQTSGTSYVIGGGAQTAADKIFQFNGRGTVNIKDFYANGYGKVIRACGNCADNGGPRNVILDGVVALNGGPLCGINTNYGDTCTITNSCQNSGQSCELYKGVQQGSNSLKLSAGADNISCWVSGFSSTC